MKNAITISRKHVVPGIDIYGINQVEHFYVWLIHVSYLPILTRMNMSDICVPLHSNLSTIQPSILKTPNCWNIQVSVLCVFSMETWWLYIHVQI